MEQFMGKDFLLSTKVAKKIYNNFAADMPIIDYHCHVNPKEIYEDKHFDNIYQVWLTGDHYKWRIMRSNGIDERYITGDATDYEKFQKFSECLPKAIGNPMYHWCHLELKKYFGFNGVLSSETAREVWDLSVKTLKRVDMGVRGIINKSNVAFIGTTDDPIDSLEWHKKLAADDTFKTVVAPSFRPDKALNIEKNGWCDYIEQLSKASGVEIKDLATLKQALKNRIEYFNENGCKASDHGLDYMVYEPSSAESCDDLMASVLGGATITAKQAEGFKTELLLFCAKEYKRLGWVMQLHYNCLRNPNSKLFELLGVDTGFDCISPAPSAKQLAGLLDNLELQNNLPKTIIYSLDPSDNAFIDTLIGSFQGTDAKGKIQHGSAWWFNDNKQGMKDQLVSLANLSLLGNFVGMLTDSRSFLSYTRHEYFRRILCAIIGEWVESGEYPYDEKALEEIVKGICYNNAKTYFGLEEK